VEAAKIVKFNATNPAEVSTSKLVIMPKQKKRAYSFAKRCVDIIGASLGIILLSWVFLIIAIAIKLEDPKGTVFFKQKRIGKNGKEFYMLKFRSMVTDAEQRLKDLLKQNEVQGAMFKMKNDPRVTKVGKFIRKTSLDELPQLFNVLAGDMSLVGPRPPLQREVDEYTAHDRHRLLVKPGCTGLWQVSGRNDLTFSEMVELDLYYIKKRCLLMDFMIMLRTVIVMITAKGAY
jgi:exopolysaccharide biosynthesis polyprenyl glycosylphosphotransferase